jgi:hypothetical protein
MNFNIIYKDATISLIPLIFVSAMKMKYNWTRVLSLNLLLYRFLASLISLRIRLQKSEYWTRVLSLNLLSLTQVFYKGKTVNQEFLRWFGKILLYNQKKMTSNIITMNYEDRIPLMACSVSWIAPVTPPRWVLGITSLDWTRPAKNTIFMRFSCFGFSILWRENRYMKNVREKEWSGKSNEVDYNQNKTKHWREYTIGILGKSCLSICSLNA